MREGLTARFTGRKRVALLAMTGAVAAVLVGLAVPAAASSGGGATPPVKGAEHCQAISTSATSPTADVICWGAFTAGGVDKQGNTVDTLVFPGGSIKVKHSAGAGAGSFDPTTCLSTESLTGTYTLSDGTGKYKGVSGTGRFATSIVAWGPIVKGKCSTTLPATAFQEIIQGTGPVTLP